MASPKGKIYAKYWNLAIKGKYRNPERDFRMQVALKAYLGNDDASKICDSTFEDFNLSYLVVQNLQLPEEMKVTAKCTKLVLYDGKTCFIHNSSSCWIEGKFGTATLQLPVEGGHEGGSLNVHYGGRKKRLESHNSSYAGPKQSSALLATEQGQSFRRKFKGDFEGTEGFCDSQGNGERLSTNNSLPAESVGLSTSTKSSNPAGIINATHQADVHSIPSTVCTTSRTNAPGPSMQSTTNPAVEKTANAGRKLSESRLNAAKSVCLSTSSTDGSCMSSNPAGFINANHQADIRSISSTVRTASRTNAPGPSIQSTTNPAVEKSVNAGRKRAESTRTRDTALALPTAPTLPTARSNIDIEQFSGKPAH
ncbi:hypothetical protein DAPPUDRAFT_270375 [Daphnia pulex]|uniref:Uncharacterized protein n=1 Tax=Daphnia pulex TaxID=6669 RepID=E9I0L6_DAPPU|nr:hypothetical protein DAPPUDRAFT_270375 [Daphnia pulex]|eukprot:EFX62464.1 hypothetical protein DAPPUDRAFT_270375 [Daphnia pulex]